MMEIVSIVLRSILVTFGETIVPADIMGTIKLIIIIFGGRLIWV